MNKQKPLVHSTVSALSNKQQLKAATSASYSEHLGLGDPKFDYKTPGSSNTHSDAVPAPKSQTKNIVYMTYPPQYGHTDIGENFHDNMPHMNFVDNTHDDMSPPKQTSRQSRNIPSQTHSINGVVITDEPSPNPYVSSSASKSSVRFPQKPNMPYSKGYAHAPVERKKIVSDKNYFEHPYGDYKNEAANGYFHSTEKPFKKGLHPDAAAWLKTLGLEKRVTQTIGKAPASAGVHEAEYRGSKKNRQIIHWPSAKPQKPVEHDYCAAVDINVQGMSQKQIQDTIHKLGLCGFAAWYRKPGDDGWPSKYSEHIHAVYAGVQMKDALRHQVEDYLQNKTGLKHHRRYGYMKFGDDTIETVRDRFRTVYGNDPKEQKYFKVK